MSICQFSPIINNNHHDDEYREIKLVKHLGHSLPEIGSLSDLIRELNKLFASDNVNVDLVHYVMKAYKSNPMEWKKFAKFDRFRYTRNLVDNGNGKYNLMLLCWGEGQGSGIHDHANSHCFMKMLQGSLEEIRFAWPKKEETELEEIGRTRMNLNEVCYINDSLGLHRVENVSSYDTAISLHLYCPPYDRCTVFNQRNGKKSSSTVTFYSMFGKRNKHIQNKIGFKRGYAENACPLKICDKVFKAYSNNSRTSSRLEPYNNMSDGARKQHQQVKTS